MACLQRDNTEHCQKQHRLHQAQNTMRNNSLSSNSKEWKSNSVHATPCSQRSYHLVSLHYRWWKGTPVWPSRGPGGLCIIPRMAPVLLQGRNDQHGRSQWSNHLVQRAGWPTQTQRWLVIWFKGLVQVRSIWDRPPTPEFLVYINA